MNRPNTREGLAANIGSAATYINQYYYATDVGLYYYSDGSDWKISIFDQVYSVTNYSGAITTGGTAQLVMVANLKRKWLLFQNTSSADMYIGIGYAPTAINGLLVAKAGGQVRFDTFIPTDAIYVLCDTSTKTFCCLEG